MAEDDGRRLTRAELTEWRGSLRLARRMGAIVPPGVERAVGEALLLIDERDAALAEIDRLNADRHAAIRAFVARVMARAEADMLAGNPLTGAHFRSLVKELEELEV